MSIFPGPLRRAVCAPSRSRPGAGGFTLVEILLAVAIAAMILGVVYALYHTVTMAVTGHRSRDTELSRAGRALEEVSRDLTALFAGPADDCRPQLMFSEGSDSNRSEISFCTLRQPPGEADLRWVETRQVRYRLESAAGEGTRLICESRVLAGPGAETMETNALLGGVAAFRVQLFNGTDWQAEWEPAENQPPPRGARVEIETAREPRVFRTEVFIPAGLVFTSRLERATAP